LIFLYRENSLSVNSDIIDIAAERPGIMFAVPALDIVVHTT